MSYNEEKMRDIILDRYPSIEERCEGYRDILFKTTIEDILTAEKEHSLQRTNIQQKVDDICAEAGEYLYQHQSKKTDGGI